MGGSTARNRRQQEHHRFYRFRTYRMSLLAVIIEFSQFVDQFHHRSDCGVEGVTTADIIGNFFDGLMQLAPNIFLR